MRKRYAGPLAGVGGVEVHHMPNTWVNSCREAGFSRVGLFHNLRTGQIHAEG